MFEKIPHQEWAQFGPQGPLRPGDWLVAINGEQVPFDGVSILPCESIIYWFGCMNSYRIIYWLNSSQPP